MPKCNGKGRNGNKNSGGCQRQGKQNCGSGQGRRGGRGQMNGKGADSDNTKENETK